MLSPALLPKRLLASRALFSHARLVSAFQVPATHNLMVLPGMDGKRYFSKKASPSQAPYHHPRPKLLGNNEPTGPTADGEVPSDVLYEYKRNTYFTMISSASLLQIAFWSWLKGTEASLPIVTPVVAAPQLDPSFLSIVTNEAWSSVGLGSSVIMALVVVFFSQRSIARISVISGGGKLRLTTHKFLGGLSTPLDYPVAQLRAAGVTDKYISVKVADQPGYYLIDTDGQFFNRSKLDQLLKLDATVSGATKNQPAQSIKPKHKQR
ncbi:Aste57867_23368 [Aphanomyces stellatus]|uniref:Aste57867_23368 protein n=1 Tax=Aphanomyces stellatus TaxID=120398 RepID=A0A485LMX1_9STRA|nr:hypothetical protein As57867_023297 [Aphanomyces stellatus]VFU00014.1 Aste57867_23368 [Aphanomyces stellatus]